MKKLSLVIAFIIALSNLTFAQKSKKGAASGIEPPTAVLKTFNTKYKLAKKTVWSEEEEIFRADFKLNDITMAVAYSGDGKLLYTEKVMNKAQYNKTALKYIYENYAGYKVTNMRKRDTYDKKTTYFTTLKKSREVLEVEFDKKGGFIRDTDRTPVSASKKKGKKNEDEETNTDEEDKPAKKDVKVKDKKKTNDDEENTDEEAAPAKKETKAKPSKKTEDNEDAEEAKPAPKKETKAKPAPKKTDDDEDEDEAKPAPKKEKAKPAKKDKKKTTEDDEDDE